MIKTAYATIAKNAYSVLSLEHLIEYGVKYMKISSIDPVVIVTDATKKPKLIYNRHKKKTDTKVSTKETSQDWRA
jgi:hypothetical protein